jgi:hypothetical protein
MSQFGMLVFFTADRPEQPQAVIRKLLVACGASSLVCASWSPEEGHEWEKFQEPAGPFGSEDEDPLEEFIKDPSPEEVPGLFIEGGKLHVIVGVCPLGDRIASAIRAEVPASIRGQFCPAEVDLIMGYHDVFECAENFEGLYIGRPFICVSFFSYGTPEDWEASRSAILALAEVQRVKGELETICGPLEQAVYWDV